LYFLVHLVSEVFEFSKPDVDNGVRQCGNALFTPFFLPC
jgi:hypothetical protein